MKQYYETRAPEYDEWYLGQGVFSARERPGWDQAVASLTRTLGALAPATTLDVACGTGFLTRHLRGQITGLDQSEQMLAIARSRVPGATFVRGDALELPFEDGSFDRVFTGHFYGHLEPAERGRFMSEVRRVAPELGSPTRPHALTTRARSGRSERSTTARGSRCSSATSTRSSCSRSWAAARSCTSRRGSSRSPCH